MGCTLSPYKLEGNKLKKEKGESGKAMTGQQHCEDARYVDAAKVSTLMFTQGAQSFINYQEAHGHKMGMRPSQNSSLLRAVTSTSRLIMALLRCKLPRASGTPELPR